MCPSMLMRSSRFDFAGTVIVADGKPARRVSPARSAPSEPRQGRKAAAVRGRSDAMRVAYPSFL